MNNPLIIALYKHLNQLLEQNLDNLISPSEKLKEAIVYSVLGNSKRLRPLLVYLAGNALGCLQKKLDAAALAVEFIHCYSLIHDDLPAMDNDDLRRGKPSCHKAFDEATAILAGDALQNIAMDTILNADALSFEQRIAMAKTLTRANGAPGMVSGQALDLALLHEKNISGETLSYVHELKTGHSISACVRLAMIAAEEKVPEKIKSLNDFARHLGLAFQIQDDYLDAYGKTDTLGKKQGSDLRQKKTTYANLYDHDSLMGLIAGEYDKAITALSPLQHHAHELVELGQALLARSH